MKKRIISLILVVVMSLLALSSCAYSYEKDDMANYASFDSAAFLAALQALEIEDGDFGVDEEQRWVKVEDAVLNAIVSKAVDKTVKVTNGKVGTTDILYYSYYYTITVGEGEDAKTYTFDTSKLTDASSNVQLGLSTNDPEKLAGKLQQAFANAFTFVEDDEATEDANETNYYVVDKTGKVEGENGVYVNVTYKVAEKDSEAGTTTNPVKHTNEIIFVPFTKVEEAADVPLSFAEQLYGKDVAKALETITVRTGENTSLVYTEVTVNFKMNMANDADLKPIVIEGVKYEKKDSDKDDTKITDAYGNETTAGVLNGQEMVYYIFPCYYVDVEESLTIETLLYKILGENLSSSSLEIFGTETSYKNGEEHISKLVDALKTKIKEYNTADKAVTTAKTTYDSKLTALKNGITDTEKKNSFVALLETALAKYDEKQAATGDAATAAKEAYDAAYKALFDFVNGENGATATAKSDFKTAYDSKLTADEKLVAADKARTEAKDKVLGCLENTADMANRIVESYKEYQYKTLASTYQNTVVENVMHEIMELAQGYIKYNGTYPKKALKEAIERVENELKYNFYTGTYSGTDTTLKDKTNYVAFNASYDNYVIYALGLNTGASKAEIEAAIQAKAEAAIKDVILVYTLVDFLRNNNLDDVQLTKDEEKNIKTQVRSYSNVRESDFRVAYMFEKVFEYFMATDEKGDKPEKVEKGAEGYADYLTKMAEYNTVIFKNVKIAADAE